MNLQFTADEEAFREQVRSWIKANLPEEWKVNNVKNDRDARDHIDQEWDRLLFKQGWAMISWPKKYGGMDATLAQQLIFYEEMAKADAPKGLWQGKGLVGPTILTHGTEEQRERFIPPILRGDVVWCQGWSEPNAGSDLPNLRTKGVIDGDYLVITGQKIWSTWAHIADWCFALVRTSNTQPGHKGLTYVLIDMKTPGVTVRPIRQITKDRDYGEIFFDEARIPLSNVVGGIDKGWYAAMTTLADERTSAYFDLPIRHLRILEQLVDLARHTVRNRKPVIQDPIIRQKLAQCRIEIESFRYAVLRTVSAKIRGQEPGAESWILKVYWTEIMQRLSSVALDIEGPYSQIMKGSERAISNGHWPYYYLWMRCETIAGGTSDINRNTLAERILEMPR
ncbi:acyl-CoA dehydrogenase family protein [Noviherbaspirillum sedimenti]|uniref:Isovaleryl-CoA dehydrogenase n=1 Tax=Noviherbaspirillum sedimenti TaxID=2320865 RepID=A0A3A3G4S8_9BURK|nr:acyl-CoA dehydrogenase family protein [Noviherbaspirillum sedimenti]RJG02675.1 isovaleryl-CoA dehydrogenase [Noviherbaspirillum sedimenti]